MNLLTALLTKEHAKARLSRRYIRGVLGSGLSFSPFLTGTTRMGMTRHFSLLGNTEGRIVWRGENG